MESPANIGARKRMLGRGTTDLRIKFSFRTDAGRQGSAIGRTARHGVAVGAGQAMMPPGLARAQDSSGIISGVGRSSSGAEEPLQLTQALFEAAEFGGQPVDPLDAVMGRLPDHGRRGGCPSE